MEFVLTLVWYPWTEGTTGPAGTQGAFKTLDLRVEAAPWPRLPAVGETVFFDDGGAANVEAVGWKLDGIPYLYLGRHYEKKGETLQLWAARGFVERPSPPPPEAEAETTPDAPSPSADEAGQTTRSV